MVSVAVQMPNTIEFVLTVLAAPYADQHLFARYADPPRPEQVVHQTFCGT